MSGSGTQREEQRRKPPRSATASEAAVRIARRLGVPSAGHNKPWKCATSASAAKISGMRIAAPLYLPCQRDMQKSLRVAWA